MILSRNWLNEFVNLKDITDKEFNDEMTLSGSKVETIERPDENLKNVVVGKILEMKRHENSDHMLGVKSTRTVNLFLLRTLSFLLLSCTSALIIITVLFIRSSLQRSNQIVPIFPQILK